MKKTLAITLFSLIIVFGMTANAFAAGDREHAAVLYYPSDSEVAYIDNLSPLEHKFYCTFLSKPVESTTTSAGYASAFQSITKIVIDHFTNKLNKIIGIDTSKTAPLVALQRNYKMSETGKWDVKTSEFFANYLNCN